MTLFDWSKKRVLVTGGHGFLGKHLISALQNRGCTSILAPRRTECDLRDPLQVQSLFSESFDLVYHLAASVGGIGANQKRPADFFYDNMLMGIYVLEQAARTQVGRYVQVGTICAYPKFAPIPFREDALWDGYPEETNAPYGVAKRSLVVGAEAYRKQYGLKYVALFPTNLYGSEDDFDLETSHVIPALIRKCVEAKKTGKNEIELWGTGKPSRDFLYVKDAVKGLLLAGEKTGIEGEMMNLGSGEEVTIADLATLIKKVTGFQGDLRWNPSRPDGQPRRAVSAEKATQLLGFSVDFALREGLVETVQWYREHAES